MRITANRRDDIIKQRNEFNRQKADKVQKYEKQVKDYDEAMSAVTDKVEKDLRARLAKFDKLHFDVSVAPAFFRDRGLSVSVECNRSQLFADDSALSWTYSVKVDDKGRVIAETGSWSGLQATTATQLDSLEQTLGALRELNKIDWKTEIDVDTPEYGDYVNVLDPRYDVEPDFNAMLMEADVDDLVGTNRGIYRDATGSSRYYRGRVYSVIVGQSDKTYTVFDIPEMYAEDIDKFDTLSTNTYRISKKKFIDSLIVPMNIKDFQ